MACWLSGSAAALAENAKAPHTFHLEGGYFYGPGPIVPDTILPSGKLANIHFDVRSMRGYCEFGNDGTRAGLLSDGKTRINQNIDAGRLLVGGGTSPTLLTAVDGGPHKGTEQYYLDEEYRFVWRVDIALDPGFAEGIIRLDDFVLTTGIVRIGRSLQTQRGEPGGYDQAGTLPAGTFLVGRVGDFDQDDLLDGILVAAPHVPLGADMLPGAPVGNRRGFRTDVRIAANVSAELMLRGVLHLREPLLATIQESDAKTAAELAADMHERLRIVHLTAQRAHSERLWPSSADPVLAELRKLAADSQTLVQRFAQGLRAQEATTQLAAMFERTQRAIEHVAARNEKSSAQLPRGAPPKELLRHLPAAKTVQIVRDQSELQHGNRRCRHSVSLPGCQLGAGVHREHPGRPPLLPRDAAAALEAG